MSENTVYMAMLILMILAAADGVAATRIEARYFSTGIPYSDVVRLGNVMLGREVPDGES